MAKSKPTEKTKGRPTKYTKALGEKICARIADGESLRSICNDKNIPHKATIFRWLLSDSPTYSIFRDQYEKARSIQYEALADEIFDVADDGRNDWMERNAEDNEGYITNGEAIQRSRLRVDTRKWFLSKVLPKYADKKEVKHSGEVTHRYAELSDEELELRIQEMVKNGS